MLWIFIIILILNWKTVSLSLHFIIIYQAVATYEDGKLTNENKADEANGKQSTSTREITDNGELLLVREL